MGKFSDLVSPINCFNIPSSFRGEKKLSSDDIKVLHSKGYGYISKSIYDSKSRSGDLTYKYKVVVSRTVSEHANEPNKDGTFKVLSKTVILPPGEVCTHSYLVVASFDNAYEAENCIKFLHTKIVRFLILQTITGIDLSSSRFTFVPKISFKTPLSDNDMYKTHELTENQISHIEKLIRKII